MIKTFIILLAAGLLGPTVAIGQISIIASGATGGSTYSLTGGPYTQNFDALPSSGTFTWANHSTLPGWFAADSIGGFNATGKTVNGTGTNIDDLTLYSIGASASTDRALVYHTRLASSPTHLGLAFTNNSGQALTSFTLAYSPEQWKESGSARNLTVTVQYRVGAAPTDLY
jgi:hypothetical protein